VEDFSTENLWMFWRLWIIPPFWKWYTITNDNKKGPKNCPQQSVIFQLEEALRVSRWMCRIKFHRRLTGCEQQEPDALMKLQVDCLQEEFPGPSKNLVGVLFGCKLSRGQSLVCLRLRLLLVLF
jgi:hypothetical protein